MTTLPKLVLALFAAGVAGLQAGATVAPLAAEAEAAPLISYDFAQAVYAHGWLEDGVLGSGAFEDQDGYAFSMQKSFSEHLYGFGSFGQMFAAEEVALGSMVLDGEMRSKNMVLGVGGHWAVRPGIDWILQVGATYNHSRVDLEGTTPLGRPYAYGDAFRSEGFGVQAATGLRIAVTDWLEWSLLYPLARTNLDAEIMGMPQEREARAEHSFFTSLIFRKLGGGPVDVVVTGLVSENAQRISAGLRLNF